MANFNLEVKNAVEALKAGNIILFPTDTHWSLGCDANNKDALKKLYTLKQSYNERNITCFVADDRMLSKYVKQVPFAAQSIIEVADTPTTIIYDAPQNLASNLIAKDNTIAIRIPDDDFCYWLSRKMNGAIVSTSANISGEPTPQSYSAISEKIINSVDYVVDLNQDDRSFQTGIGLQPTIGNSDKLCSGKINITVANVKTESVRTIRSIQSKIQKFK